MSNHHTPINPDDIDPEKIRILIERLERQNLLIDLIQALHELPELRQQIKTLLDTPIEDDESDDS